MLAKCNYCYNKKFESLESSLGEELKKYGFPYRLRNFETLNYKHYACSSCGSSDRDRLYKYYVESRSAIDPYSNILDFAPSKVFEDYMRTKTKKYRTADLLLTNYDEKVDIMDMRNHKDNSLDFFICSHILEHVGDDKKALNELYRVLKKGGRGILMTPIINKDGAQDEDPAIIKAKERWRRFAQDDHVRLYEKRIFLERVKNTGFSVKEYGFWNLGILNMLRLGLTLKSRLYLVGKE